MTTNTEPTPELHSGFSSPGSTATPWHDVAEALDQAEIYWISTVRADGRPHVTPLPAMWLDGALHFGTGLEEQKGRNLTRDPHCVLTTGTNSYRHGLDVVVEGRAERVTDRGTLERLAQMWRSRLDWAYDVDDEGFRHRLDGQAPNVEAGTVVPVFAVRPVKVLSFARGEHFTQTRFRP
ncbi:pyridoxamine 5'-phosphate oxidase family protein [uncultured Jatrophihabitans sp.]|uniref:pyridoxamine 5'-phosphate oxidase family protein n=1 Tax=uncultured Jatrophihabitans sp. TaxID=1610747 RepID=UPI0035CBA5B4